MPLGGGNVGIGMSNPQEALDINGAMHLTPQANPPTTANDGDIYADTDDNLYYFSNSTWQALNGGGGDGNGIYSSDATISGARAVGLGSTLNFDNNTFVIDGSANAVAMGHISPVKPLDLRGTRTGEGLMRIQNYSNTGFSDIEFYDDGSPGANVAAFGYGNSGITGTFSYLADRVYFYRQTKDFVISGNSGIDVMFKADGKVGIGTDNPSDVLEVDGAVVRKGFCQVDNSGINQTIGPSANFRFNTSSSNQRIDSYYNLPNDNQVEILADGWYRISYHLYCDFNSGSGKPRIESDLYINGAPSPVMCTDFHWAGNTFSNTEKDGVLKGTVILNLTSNDLISVLLTRSGTGDFIISPNKGFILIEKI
jgi:hypothetical protein